MILPFLLNLSGVVVTPLDLTQIDPDQTTELVITSDLFNIDPEQTKPL